MSRTVHLAADCEPGLKKWFSEKGFEVESVRTEGIVSVPVSNHPDMFMCKMGCAEDSEIVPADFSVLSPDYPHDIAYNAACTGRFFIHNLRYTAPELMARATDLGMTPVNVRQGYAKCSIVIVDEDSIITYDQGIASACKDAGIDVLTVEPGHVLLPGYNTGFIGGASGRIGNTVYFNGDLTAHPDCGRIIEFIEARGLKVKWFSEWPLTDIGSII
ncbi:MAG: hypothetical protein IJH90_08120 [Mogibacterium sp.]|nr:hypothetical protein [Mogibacterium sp.]